MAEKSLKIRVPLPRPTRFHSTRKRPYKRITSTQIKKELQKE